MKPPAVILAGGLARRMGGGDKTLLPLGERPLLAHVAARLAPQAGALAISANGDPARFAAFGLPVLADSVEGRPGPLAGILAAMDWAAGRGAAHVLTAAGDTPFPPADLAARLGATLAAGAPLALAAAPSGRLHPVFGLWPAALRDDLRAALAAGTRKVADWALARGGVPVAFPDLPYDPFFNVNRPGDIAEAERILLEHGL